MDALSPGKMEVRPSAGTRLHSVAADDLSLGLIAAIAGDRLSDGALS